MPKQLTDFPDHGAVAINLPSSPSAQLWLKGLTWTIGLTSEYSYMNEDKMFVAAANHLKLSLY